jgi:hypothetical protein
LITSQTKNGIIIQSGLPDLDGPYTLWSQL